MPSELGSTIRSARESKDMRLRELARQIQKSPAFITQLECDDVAPAVSEDTLVAIAQKLGIDPDTLLVIARRVPRDVVPESPLELALYRRIKAASEDQKRAMLKSFDQSTKRKK